MLSAKFYYVKSPVSTSLLFHPFGEPNTTWFDQLRVFNSFLHTYTLIQNAITVFCLVALSRPSYGACAQHTRPGLPYVFPSGTGLNLSPSLGFSNSSHCLRPRLGLRFCFGRRLLLCR